MGGYVFYYCKLLFNLLNWTSWLKENIVLENSLVHSKIIPLQRISFINRIVLSLIPDVTNKKI